MKRINWALAIFAAGFLGVGCHAQVAPNPVTYACPGSTGATYVPINPSTPIATLTYTDAPSSAGKYCYIVQSESGSGATLAVSEPSNIVGPFNVASGDTVSLSWVAPTSGTAPTGYVVSRALAQQTNILAPTLTGTK